MTESAQEIAAAMYRAQMRVVVRITAVLLIVAVVAGVAFLGYKHKHDQDLRDKRETHQLTCAFDPADC